MKGLMKKIGIGLLCSVIAFNSLSCKSKEEEKLEKRIRSVVTTSIDNGKEYADWHSKPSYTFEVEGKPTPVVFYRNGPRQGLFSSKLKYYPAFAFRRGEVQVQATSNYGGLVIPFKRDEPGIKIYGWNNCSYEEFVNIIYDPNVAELSEELTYKVMNAIEKENMRVKTEGISQAKKDLALK